MRVKRRRPLAPQIGRERGRSGLHRPAKRHDAGPRGHLAQQFARLLEQHEIDCMAERNELACKVEADALRAAGTEIGKKDREAHALARLGHGRAV
ncbi:hypothetical protein GCM10022281_19900 [Sphingomonas rosea]|uniref:Uncharacterized protein n=1 Tax=Sphingomonas rosea TaxID=335605 RepID=A0ABP7UAI1_9SPHN